MNQSYNKHTKEKKRNTPDPYTSCRHFYIVRYIWFRYFSDNIDPLKFKSFLLLTHRNRIACMYLHIPCHLIWQNLLVIGEHEVCCYLISPPLRNLYCSMGLQKKICDWCVNSIYPCNVLYRLFYWLQTLLLLHSNVTVNSVYPKVSAINTYHIAIHCRLVEGEVQMSLCWY